MGTFINEVCISCLQLLKTLYVRMSLVLGKLICNMHSCMFVLDFGKNQKSFPTYLLIYRYLGFGSIQIDAKKAHAQVFISYFIPSLKHQKSIMQILDRQHFNCIPTVVELNVQSFVFSKSNKMLFRFFRYELTKLGHISRICGGSRLKIFSSSNVLLRNYFCGPKTSNPYINEGGAQI